MAHRTLSMRGKRLSSLTRQEIELWLPSSVSGTTQISSHLDHTIPVAKQGSCSIMLLGCRNWETEDRKKNEQIQIYPWGKWSPGYTQPQNWAMIHFSARQRERKRWSGFRTGPRYELCEKKQPWIDLKITVFQRFLNRAWAQWRKIDTAQIQVCKAGSGTPRMM